MSNSYQAIYEAVRSRIHGGNIGEVVSEIARTALDMSVAQQDARSAIANIEYAVTQPSVIYRPSLSQDGDQWVALYGENLQVGVVGCGATPELAMASFDKEWRGIKT